MTNTITLKENNIDFHFQKKNGLAYRGEERPKGVAGQGSLRRLKEGADSITWARAQEGLRQRNE